MKKLYIMPSMKVRTINSENILAASLLVDNGDGTMTQDNVDTNSTETVDGGSALSKGFNVWDPEE